MQVWHYRLVDSLQEFELIWLEGKFLPEAECCSEFLPKTIGKLLLQLSNEATGFTIPPTNTSNSLKELRPLLLARSSKTKLNCCSCFYRPDLIDMNTVAVQSNLANLEHAFFVAEKLGVARLLDPEGELGNGIDQKCYHVCMANINYVNMTFYRCWCLLAWWEVSNHLCLITLWCISQSTWRWWRHQCTRK